MNEQDLRCSRMILKLIGALTGEECTSVEIHNGNPDFNGMPACCITVHSLDAELHIISEDFRDESILGCLLLAAEKKDPKIIERFGVLDVHLYQGKPVILEKPMIDHVRHGGALARAYWITEGAVGWADIPIMELTLAKHSTER